MSLDWGPPNYIPEWQDHSRTQNTPDYDLIGDDLSDSPASPWRFLDTTGFKVVAVLGMTWVAFMCFEAYQSSFHTARHARRASTLAMHGHSHRKD